MNGMDESPHHIMKPSSSIPRSNNTNINRVPERSLLQSCV